MCQRNFVMALAAAALMLGVTVLYETVLQQPQDVVPLFLAPALLYLGYAAGRGGVRTWILAASAVTGAMAMLYAF